MRIALSRLNGTYVALSVALLFVAGCEDAPAHVILRTVPMSVGRPSPRAGNLPVSPQQVLLSAECRISMATATCERYWCGGKNNSDMPLNFGNKIAFCGLKKCLEAKMMNDYHIPHVVCEKQEPDYVPSSVPAPDTSDPVVPPDAQ